MNRRDALKTIGLGLIAGPAALQAVPVIAAPAISEAQVVAFAPTVGTFNLFYGNTLIAKLPWDITQARLETEYPHLADFMRIADADAP